MCSRARGPSRSHISHAKRQLSEGGEMTRQIGITTTTPAMHSATVCARVAVAWVKGGFVTTASRVGSGGAVKAKMPCPAAVSVLIHQRKVRGICGRPWRSGARASAPRVGPHETSGQWWWFSVTCFPRRREGANETGVWWRCHDEYDTGAGGAIAALGGSFCLPCSRVRTPHDRTGPVHLRLGRRRPWRP